MFGHEQTRTFVRIFSLCLETLQSNTSFRLCQEAGREKCIQRKLPGDTQPESVITPRLQKTGSLREQPVHRAAR